MMVKQVAKMLLRVTVIVAIAAVVSMWGTPNTQEGGIYQSVFTDALVPPLYAHQGCGHFTCAFHPVIGWFCHPGSEGIRTNCEIGPGNTCTETNCD